MDVDDDDNDDSLGLGYLGSIVPDADDDVSNMLLAQLGSTPIAAGAPTKRDKPSRPMSTHQADVTLPEAAGYAPPGPNAGDIRGVMAATPSDFHCEVADVIANQVLSSLGKSHARDKR